MTTGISGVLRAVIAQADFEVLIVTQSLVEVICRKNDTRTSVLKEAYS
jgi:hypothetical protein